MTSTTATTPAQTPAQPTASPKPARRRTALAILALCAIGLAGYMVFNAIQLSSQQTESQGVPTYDINEEKIAEHLAHAVSIKTVSTEEEFSSKAFDELASYLEQTFPRVRAALTRERVGPTPDKRLSLLFTWKGTNVDLKPALLISHQDVVPAKLEDGWTLDPFGFSKDKGNFDPARLLDNQYIWGRGTLDDKLGVLGILEAAESILEANHTFRPQRTLYFGFGHDEEVAGNGARAIAQVLKDKERVHGEKPLVCVIDEGTAVVRGLVSVGGFDRPVAPIGVVEKGYVDINLSVEQPGGHSSDAPKQTAIGILSQAIERLERKPFPTHMPKVTRETLETVGAEMAFDYKLVFGNVRLLDPILRAGLAPTPATNAMIRTTAAVTIVSGGEKDNILPRLATATINYRVLPPDREEDSEKTVEEVRSHVEQVIDDDRVCVCVDPNNRFPPSHESSTRSASYVALRQVIADVFDKTGPLHETSKLKDKVVVTPYIVTAGTDARNYEPICDSVYRFLPVELSDDDLAMIHGVNERISKAGYVKVVVFYRHLIETLARPLGSEGNEPSHSTAP